MKWLKIIGALLGLISQRKQYTVESSVAELSKKLDGYKEEAAQKKYIAIKSYNETDKEFIMEMARISDNPCMRYFLFDLRELAIEKNDIEQAKAIMNITKRLRAYEITALTGGLNGNV